MNTYLEIPSAKPAAAPTQSPANPSPRILVVEDDLAIRRLSAQLLK